MIARVIWLVLLLAVFPMAAVSAQVGPDAEPVEDEPVVEEAEEAKEPEQRESLIVAAGWCTFQSKTKTNEEPAENAAPGCDLGVGVSLYGSGRWRVVAAVGSWSVGAGLAWVALKPERGPVIAVALGLMAPYDSSGIDPHPRLALGATFGF